MKELYDQLAKIEPFAILTKRELELLVEDSTLIRLNEGDALFQPGGANDGIYLVLSGGVKLLRNYSEHHQLILEFFAPGELALEDGGFKEVAHCLEARAMVESEVLKINFKTIKKLLNSNSKFVETCLEVFSQLLNSYRERLEAMVFMNTEARLANALMALARKFGKKDEKGTLIDLKITHQDLADFIASSRETVSLVLSQFRRKRLILNRVRWIIIPDLKALRKILEI